MKNPIVAFSFSFIFITILYSNFLLAQASMQTFHADNIMNSIIKQKDKISSNISQLNLKQDSLQSYFQKNDIFFGIGYGFPNLLATAYIEWDFIFPVLKLGKTVFESYDNYTTSTKGPYYFNLSYTLNKEYAFGIKLAQLSRRMNFTTDGYDSLNNKKTFDYQIDISSFSILFCLTAHIGNYKKFDPYYSYGLGLRINTTSTVTNEVPASYQYEFNGFPLCISSTLGSKYYFTNFLAAYAEVGIAGSPFQVGILFRLNNDNINQIEETQD